MEDRAKGWTISGVKNTEPRFTPFMSMEGGLSVMGNCQCSLHRDNSKRADKERDVIQLAEATDPSHT